MRSQVRAGPVDVCVRATAILMVRLVLMVYWCSPWVVAFGIDYVSRPHRHDNVVLFVSQAPSRPSWAPSSLWSACFSTTTRCVIVTSLCGECVWFQVALSLHVFLSADCCSAGPGARRE